MLPKNVVKSLCNSIRLNEALVAGRRNYLLVLVYHGIVAQARRDRRGYENWDPADLFQSQLDWLKTHFDPIGLDGMAKWQEGGWKSRRPPVLLTFDDGYRNNLTVAAPILLKAGVPAVFFLTTGYVGTGRLLWNDEIRARVASWPLAQIRTPRRDSHFVPEGEEARRQLSDRLNRECKTLADADREAYLLYLRGETNGLNPMQDPEARAFLDWDEARQLVEMGFEVGSHTVDHPILSRVDVARAVAELRESKATIERELNRPCRAIAYPNGSSEDFNDSVIEAARRCGYQWAFTTIRAWARPGGDSFRIPRIGFPGHTDLATFKLYASGLA
jgi:peptidoglycan/xylan/chitin deacetylase (PgdA/CDA1 family)